jgi:N-acetylmuramoyl-L-alanine amidase
MDVVLPSTRGGRRSAVGLLVLLLLCGCTSAQPVSVAGSRTTTTAVPATIDSDPETAEAPPQGGVAVAPPKLNAGVTLIASPKGVIVPVLASEGEAFKVSTPCGVEAVTPGQPVEAIDVVLDPGHGGGESGAVGPNGLREKDLNATVAGFARNALVQAGIRTIPTRNGDYRMTLSARGLLAQAAKPKAFVSIHHNAGSNAPSPIPGTDVYYQVASPESKRLGGLVYEEVTKTLGSMKGITWAAGSFPGVKLRLNDKGEDYFGVVRRTNGMPGVLVEMGYISNPSEAAAFADRRIQQAEGEAVARGIYRFLRTADPGSGYVDVPDPKQGPLGGGGGGAQGCVDPAF